MTRQQETAVVEYESAADARPPDDPYVLGDGAVVDPPTRLSKALTQIGPGLILAGAIVGTGELIATTNLGATVGFTLLWLVILSCFIKVFVQAELGRYAISSGETTMMSFRRLPGPGAIVGWWWVIMMLITQLQLGAMTGGVGQAFHMALPGVSPAIARALGSPAWLVARPEIPWAALTAAVTIVLLARGSYRMVEWGTTTMVVAFTLVTIGCVALLPVSGHPIPWGEVGRGLGFSLPRESIAYALAMFGITGVGAAELVAYPYWCIEKGYACKTGRRDESAAWLGRAKGWLRVMRLDCWVSCGIYTVATLAFYFLGAAVLHGGGGKALPGTVGGMLDVLSRMYVPVMGSRVAIWFMVIGVFAVLYSTLFAATGANSRVLADFLKVNGFVSFDRPGDRKRLVRLFCIIFPIIDLALFLWVGNPLKMVIIGGVAQALTLPMLGAAAIYLRYRRTDQRLAPGKAWDLFLWVSLAGLILAAGVGVWDQWKKLM
jgi:Mn2+/Fe2+ NRAMP family transporter